MDINKLLHQAAPPLEGQNAAEAFERRMAEMQQELQQMEKIKGEMQKDKTQLQKTLQPLQRELDEVSKQLTAAQLKRQKLEKELKACEDDIVRLSEKKQVAQTKLFAFTAEATVPGLDGSIAKPPQEESECVGKDLMDGLFSGVLSASPAVASNATVAPATDLLDFGGGSACAACLNNSALGGIDAGLGGLNFSSAAAPPPPPPPPQQCAVHMPTAGLGAIPYGGADMAGCMARSLQQPSGLDGAMLAANLSHPAPPPADPFMNLLMGPNGR